MVLKRVGLSPSVQTALTSAAEASTRALMTLPSVSRDLLMAAPSLSRVPADPAVLEFSEPARSTKLTYSVWS